MSQYNNYTNYRHPDFYPLDEDEIIKFVDGTKRKETI